MGADRIFNTFLGLPTSLVVPLSISHGVDFGHLDKPMDVDGAEPIHWAYNAEIFERALKIKPTILAPHPWLMLSNWAPIGPPLGTVVVAAPPSPENDRNLLRALKGLAGPTTIIVKPRGSFQASIEFWRAQGLNATTAGAEGPDFYQNLYRILSGATKVIGCNFSSALIFAAAIGKETGIIENYSHHTYVHKATRANYQSTQVSKIAKIVINGSRDEIAACAIQLLGGSTDLAPETILDCYRRSIRDTTAPVFFKRPHSRLTKKLLAETALLTGKVGVVNNLRQGISDLIFGREIYAAKVDELSLWRTGDVEKYYRDTRVKYEKGITEGGLAVSGYQD
jgi:hypothetical protein